MKKGFTLIELLIVVAIIAILAAIAVPNFLEAQTRAKVSRTKADMRSLVTALETYNIDHNSYPSDAGNQPIGTGIMRRPYTPYNPLANYTIGFELSTPVAYITSMQAFVDPFRAHRAAEYALQAATKGREVYAFTNNTYRARLADGALRTALLDKADRVGAYVLASAGPDKLINNNYQSTVDYRSGTAGNAFPLGRNYDASNGTISVGDIVRSPKFNDVGWENPDQGA